MKVASGNLISVKSTLFDCDTPGSYSKDNPGLCYGVETRVLDKRKYLMVRWTGEETSDVRVERRKLSSANILTVMILEGKKAAFESEDKSNWPPDFFHALVKTHWRKWMEAVKKEIDSWHNFNAYTEIPIEEKTPGASIVPLGEFYTRKRDQS